MLMPINYQQVGPQQVDICFYNSLVNHLNNYKCSILFYFVRTIVVGWLLISHILNKQTDDQNVYKMITALFCMMVLFNILAFIFSQWTYKNCLLNTKIINQVAQNLQHSKIVNQSNIQQISSFYQPIQNFNLKVSKNMYQFQNNILASQIDQEYKKRAERNCSSLISQSLSQDKWIKFWTQFFNLASIALFTYTIVLVSQGKGVTSTQFIFIICYLFTQVCSRLFIYLILLIVGISPLFCLIFCVYACFCKKQTKIELPVTQQATLQIVKDCEGNCPVCYQDICVNDKVIVLKCSNKHVFHDLCIKGWTSLRKNTCPVCRSII